MKRWLDDEAAAARSRRRPRSPEKKKLVRWIGPRPPPARSLSPLARDRIARLGEGSREALAPTGVVLKRPRARVKMSKRRLERGWDARF